MFHHVLRHDKAFIFERSGLFSFDDIFVVSCHPLGKRHIGLCALVFDERTHRRVLQLQIPFAQRTLDRLPLFDRRGRIDQIGDVAPFLTVVLLHLFGHDLLLMNMLLQT